jgi:hypothetical protein
LKYFLHKACKSTIKKPLEEVNIINRWLIAVEICRNEVIFRKTMFEYYTFLT